MNSLSNRFLHELGFTMPNIVEYKKDNFQVKNIEGSIVILNGNRRWMVLNTNLKEVFEVYSHFILAEGHCVCTGMGFLLRENWLLAKKEVTKVTVIEKNEILIDYHLTHNPDIMNKIEVINMDARDYKGKCDTLLVDHFEGDFKLHPSFLEEFATICNNVNHKISWMWPMENILTVSYRNYIGLSLSEIYNNIKKYYDLKTLPSFTEEQLFDFCKVFWLGNFSKCDFSKIKS